LSRYRELFLFFSGEIQNETDLQNAQDTGEIDPNTQKWLKAFFDDDPSDDSTISSLQTHPDLKTKGKKASDERAKAQHEWDEVRELVKETRAGRG
jgi:hypothetical protein